MTISRGEKEEIIYRKKEEKERETIRASNEPEGVKDGWSRRKRREEDEREYRWANEKASSSENE